MAGFVLTAKRKYSMYDWNKEHVRRKLSVLCAIEARKEILFGPCMVQREKCWREVLEKAKAVRLASSRREWTYVRDKLFKVWKAQTMNKLAVVRTTPTHVGMAAIIKETLDEVDLKILDITSTTVHMYREDTGDTTESSSDSDTDDDEEFHTPEPPRAIDKKLVHLMNTYMYKKRALTIKLMEHEIYLRKLKVLKLEKDLGLSDSTYERLKKAEESLE